ncbi:MAG: efflux RND transporter periplasmic adaptor subunit [Bacteroidales bacterium]|nr:efflux RND transporter periplasmic adaptor subunit [Bacteroidales bacterium]
MQNSVLFLFLLFAIQSMFSGCKYSQFKGETPEEKRIAIKISEVKSERIVENLSYSGTIEAVQSIPLSFRTAGTVEQVLVDVGDAVKKGQLLATLEKEDFENMYDIAKSKYQQASDAYERLKSLHANGSIPEIKWIEMETNLEQAKASLGLSKNNLDKCLLKAPINGFIGKKNIEPGMSGLNLTTAAFEIVEISSVNIKIAVPENEIGKMKKGIKAQIRVAALNDKIFDGTMANISPVADAFSRTYNVKIAVKNSEFELKPGMVCEVKLNIKSEKEIVYAPYQSVTMDSQGNAFVFLLAQNKKTVKKQIVKTGDYKDNSIEILSGLLQGQFIVVEGKEKLSDNCLISF